MLSFKEQQKILCKMIKCSATDAAQFLAGNWIEKKHLKNEQIFQEFLDEIWDIGGRD